MIHFNVRRKASIYTSFFALFIVTAYNILRIGLDFQFTESIKVTGLALLLLNFPILIIEFFAKKNQSKIFQDEYTIIAILLFICCLLGMLTIRAGYFFIIIGAICFSRNLFLYAKEIDKWEVITYIFLPFLSIWLCIVVWKGDYIHPMLLERLVINDKIHIDTLYHVSMAQMIKTYLIPSTGLNGIPFTNYHFGSHFIFACLSSILNIHLFTFYQLGYPAIFLPLLLKVLLGAPIIWSERNHTNRPYKFGFWFWAIVSATLIGVFPLFTVLVNASMELPGILVSESYNVSLSLFFIIFNICIFNFTHKENEISLSTPAFIILLPLIFLLGLTKISSLLIFNIMALYLFIRLNFFRQKKMLAFVALTALATIICLIITVDRKSGDGSFSPFHFFKTYIHLEPLKFIQIYYFWPIALIGSCIFIIIINKRKNLPHGNKFYFVIIESALLVCISGALPGLLFNIAGGSAGYFMDVSIWVSIVFTLLILPEILVAINDQINKINKKYLKIIALCLLVAYPLYKGNTMLHNFTKSLDYFIVHNLEDKQVMCDTVLPIEKMGFSERIKAINNLNSKTSNCLSKNEDYTILKQLFQIDSTPMKEKEKTILVAGNMEAISKKYPCYKYPFFIPALTGIALKNGFVFEECNGIGYGFEFYKREELKNEYKMGQNLKEKKLDIISGNIVIR